MTDTPDKIAYTARATAAGGGRNGGTSTTEDGALDLTINSPKELGGSGVGTNPEALFAAGYAACFQGALAYAGKKHGVDTSASTVTAEVGIGPHDQSFAVAVELKVTLPGVEPAKVQELADYAHEHVCPYSKATRGNVPVTVTVV